MPRNSTGDAAGDRAGEAPSADGIAYDPDDVTDWSGNVDPGNVGDALDQLAAGGGGGAPTDAEYVTLALDAGLSDERVLTAGEGVDLTDGGAGSTVTISGEDATTANKGIASFAAADFDVAAGAVSLEADVVRDADSVDVLADVDTTTGAPAKSEVLKWNGANWVPAVYNYNFTFSIASFADGEATTQLIGVGVWEADSAMSYTATYNNGPPTTAEVKMSINGAAYNKVGEMTAPAYTTGTNSDGAINYPGAKDQYLRFRLDATDGVDPDIEYETAVYFRNKIFWGPINKANGLTEADVEGLAGSAISNDQTRSVSVNAGGGEYVAFAFPATYTSLPVGDDYEDDGGGTGYRFNGVTCACIEDNAALAITNTAGFTENYKVYVSTLANLGNSTLTTYTNRTELNTLYYGITVKADTFLEADIEGLANSTITNDNTQVWNSVTTGVGEYMLFAFPKRLGIPTFWVGGFEGGFEAPETVSVTNSQGWSEDYYAWRSTNSNLGATVVETK